MTQMNEWRQGTLSRLNGLLLGDRGDSEMVCLLRRAGVPPLFAKPPPRGRMKQRDESDWGHLCKTGVLWPCLKGA